MDQRIYTDGRANDPFAGIDLGDRAIDTLTGFTGIVVARVQYLTGCNQLLLLPACEKNNVGAISEWFDVQRVAVVETRAVDVVARPAGRDLPLPAAR